jgi:alkylhydroperoxidase family enzyme
VKAFVRFVQRQAERQLRVPADYLRQLGDTSSSGFLKFLMILPAAAHRHRSAPALVHAVRIAATQSEDCGPCVQIAVNAAIDEGVEPDTIRAILHRNYDQMPKEVALVLTFAEGVLAKDGSEEKARDEIARELGQAVVTELSLAIATARVFPSLKRGLGFARSCASVKVEVESRREGRPTKQ